MKINNYVWENDLSLNDLVLKQKEKIDELEHQLQQKENIIKEVREYIKAEKVIKEGNTLEQITNYEKKLLEILDKEGNSNE